MCWAGGRAGPTPSLLVYSFNFYLEGERRKEEAEGRSRRCD